MNIDQLLNQATTKDGNIDIKHYTYLVLLEAARLVKETKITGAYTTFDEQVAITQRAECFNAVSDKIEDYLNASI